MILKKVRLFIDYEKEEKWLNDMAEKGWQLKRYGLIGRYYFEKEEEKYIYRIEFLDKLSSHPESIEYIRFLEESGIEYIHSAHGYWIYLRKKATDGSFDLYTDLDSKIKHYQKINRFVSIAFMLNLLICMYNFFLRFLLHTGNINILISSINLVCVILVASAYLSYGHKIKKLKLEKQLRQ